ncbi:MAG: hypothetical protein ACRC37_01320 [Lentisphaeria bacterium]
MHYKGLRTFAFLIIYSIANIILGDIKSEQGVKNGLELIKSDTALIVASSPSNTVEVKSLKRFEPPIFMIGGNVADGNYSTTHFDWWESYSCMSKPEIFDSYEALNKYFTPQAKGAISKQSFELFKVNNSLKSEKRTIHYLISLQCMNEYFLIIGSSQGEHIAEMPNSCGVTIMKKIEDRWFHHIYRDLNESLIYRLPLTRFEEMVKLINNKVWSATIFDNFEFKQLNK